MLELKVLRDLATQAGFDLVGIAPAGATTTVPQYQHWLESGYHGEMAYLARPDAVAKRGAPLRILPEAQSIMSVALNYHTQFLPPSVAQDRSIGIIASYAWGDDYHDLMLPRLHRIGGLLRKSYGEAVTFRAYVDTGPLLERELAARSDLGFIGKNTCLINPRFGSWLLLGELLISLEPPVGAPERRRIGHASASSDAAFPDLRDPVRKRPRRRSTCGQCTRCLDACPTGALVAPYVLDARLCISYLTIEHKGVIPRRLRPFLGNRIFGCDICQEVCPWNRRFSRSTAEPSFQAGLGSSAPHLIDFIALSPEGFAREYGKSPLFRSKRARLLRNAAVALGNWRSPTALPPLAAALHDPDALVRGHAAWALGQIASDDARSSLRSARGGETDFWVISEMEAALSDPAP